MKGGSLDQELWSPESRGVESEESFCAWPRHKKFLALSPSGSTVARGSFARGPHEGTNEKSTGLYAEMAGCSRPEVGDLITRRAAEVQAGKFSVASGL